MGTLYLVGTPIGNLEDMTLRAIRVLREVDLIAAEDTRTTRKLLSAHQIATPLTSYFEHSRLSKLDHLLDVLQTKDVALVSEAGMPAISDPGYEIVVAAIDRGIPIVPIPGPSAVLAAVAVSGLPTDQFVYLGFLPRRPGDRRRVLAGVAAEPRTLVAFESPHRVQAALEDILAVLGDRPVAVCRELTKLYEEVFRGSVSTALSHFTQPRGEFTLVVGGRPAESTEAASDADIQTSLAQRLATGLPPKEAIAQIARESGRPRRDVYRLWLASH